MPFSKSDRNVVVVLRTQASIRESRALVDAVNDRNVQLQEQIAATRRLLAHSMALIRGEVYAAQAAAALPDDE